LLLTDRAYRSRDPARVVDSGRQLLRSLGMPRFPDWFDRLQMRALLHVGPFLPGMAARGLLEKLRKESRHVVLPAEDPALAQYLARRRGAGVRINLNHLGEAVLGEAEAQHRVDGYVQLLARPDVEAISVKISAIASQIDLLAWDATLAQLIERLRVIYRAALAHRFERADGSKTPKLVNLDMEAYRDLRLTMAAFTGALDDPELRELSAGIALQAYLPDSAPLLEELTRWAQAHVQRGGAPIRVRIVKGANLLTERAESAARGWAVPIFATKGEVDASYKRMVEHACQPEHAAAVQIGIASHNVFDLAFGMVLRARHGVEANVGFELLEGMADSLQRALAAIAGDTLLYAPLVDAHAMQTAIAYLVRRLDENTAEENFLRHSFALRVGDEAWRDQVAQFERACERRNALDHGPRRTQNRAGASPTGGNAAAAIRFANEADTDFALAPNRAWIDAELARWHAREPFEVPLQIAGELRGGAPQQDGFDPSRPQRVPYRHALASNADVERALRSAVTAAPRWASRTVAARAEVLRTVARALRAARGELIAAMVLDAGKRVEQADVEVSEAIDFAEYYAHSFASLCAAHPELAFNAKGVALITPPWNFPLAIPAGGVLAALMAGNAVVLKPALETVLVAERFASLCWQAGVPMTALQLVICSDEVGSALVRDPRVQQVVLTGATDTARVFQTLRPGIPLAAETGGKNAIIVSALADRDEAIRDVVWSAFGHSGQKCSACSLLICEAEVYDDERFMQTLADAAASLPVGPSWDARSIVTPLIHPPRGALRRALSELDEGERWLLEPRADARNPRLLHPGIKLGVREGSFMHTAELFGPVLGVLRADDVAHALRLANGTPYGLTAGLHSLDEREQTQFMAQMRAGNLYLNRPITGAIVQRQPFGGYKASAYGPGAKAGGPNYVAQLCDVVQQQLPAVSCPPEPVAAALAVSARPHLGEDERERLSTGACSYGEALATTFAVDHDPSAVLGERNVLRYQPCKVLLRASAGAAAVDVLLSCAAALTVGAPLIVSLDERVAASMPYRSQLVGVKVQIESAQQAAAHVSGEIERVRVLGALEPELAAAASEALLHVATAPVLLTGRIELLHYLREQCVSQRYHRYGNLAPAKLLPALRGARTTGERDAARSSTPASALPAAQQARSATERPSLRG
jgi:RHH-type proline utilization regulon transcriptional repressor/proline dehydrogenase/delta 1-pyrroline-5-carboxylate dehydrogenase